MKHLQPAKLITTEQIIEDYFAWTKRREGYPSQAILHICGKLRPDQYGNLIPLHDRRELHLKVFAWCEWWSASLQQAPNFAAAQGLSQALNALDEPFGLITATGWVNNRVVAMQLSDIEWEKGDNAIPVYNSLTPVQYFKYDAYEPSGMGG